MAAFIGSFVEYAIKLVILAAIAFAGAVTGKKIRENKDAKSSTVRIHTGKK